MPGPFSYKVVDLYPDLKDPSLVGAWMMDPANNTLVDLTSAGNDGTPGYASIVEQTILGPFRRYLPNTGASGSTMGVANAFPLNDVTVSFWYRLDIGAIQGYPVDYYLGGTDSWGINVLGNGTTRIYDDIDNVGANRYATITPPGALVRVDAMMGSLENFFYLNGVLVGFGEFSSDDWSSFAGTLRHGSGPALFTGIVGPLFIYNTAKDQAWVTEQYLQGARAIPFKTEYGVPVSVGNETTGFVGNNRSPFDIISGTWRMSTDIIEGETCKVLECVAPGAVALPISCFRSTSTENAFGTWDFWFLKGADNNTTEVCFMASARAIRNDAAQNGYCLRFRDVESIAVQRVTAGVLIATLWNSSDSAYVINTWYNVRMLRRYDSQFTGYIRAENSAFALMGDAGAGTNPATDTTYTTSDYIILDFDAGDKFAYSDKKGNHCFTKYLGVIPPSEDS